MVEHLPGLHLSSECTTERLPVRSRRVGKCQAQLLRQKHTLAKAGYSARRTAGLAAHVPVPQNTMESLGLSGPGVDPMQRPVVLCPPVPVKAVGKLWTWLGTVPAASRLALCTFAPV